MGVFVLANTINVVVVILLPGIYKKILFFLVHMDRLGNREFGLLYGTRLPPPLHFATLVDPGNEAFVIEATQTTLSVEKSSYPNCTHVMQVSLLLPPSTSIDGV